MPNLFPLCVCLLHTYLFSYALSAQPILIEMDVEKSSTRYYRNGIEVGRPRIRKGEQVSLRVKNYNNYLYRAEITERSEDLAPVNTGSGPLGQLPGLGGGSTELRRSLLAPSLGSAELRRECHSSNSGLNGSMPQQENQIAVRAEAQPSSPSLATFTSDGSPKQLSKVERLKRSGMKQLQFLVETETALNQLNVDLDQLKQREKLRTFSVLEVEKLRLNPHIPPSRIKQDAQTILSQALNLDNGALPDLQDVFVKNDDRKFLFQIKLRHSELLKQYKLGLTHLEALNTELTDLSATETSDGSIAVMNAAFETQLLAGAQLIDQSAVFDSFIDSLQAEREEANLQEIMQIWYAYEAITSNDFSTVYTTTIKHDFTAFDVQFIPIHQGQSTEAGIKIGIDGKEPASTQTVRLAPIEVRGHGGVKINTSLGITLGGYQNAQYSYFVSEQTIQTQEEDRFAPYVASYLHFYSQGHGNVSFGGSLGLGLQVGSTVSLESANVFIGPSLFFGNSERFVLNTGMMLGKAKQLGRGFEVGQEFEGTDDDLPLTHRYRFGYGVGLSFNMR